MAAPIRILKRREVEVTPESLGIETLKVRRPTPAEIGELYREAKERAGVFNEDLERYLPAAAKVGRVALFTDDAAELAEVEAALTSERSELDSDGNGTGPS